MAPRASPGRGRLSTDDVDDVTESRTLAFPQVLIHAVAVPCRGDDVEGDETFG
jgi:hypothetical protein